MTDTNANTQNASSAIHNAITAVLNVTVTGFKQPVVELRSDGFPGGDYSFLFSPGGRCSQWIPVPYSIVDTIDDLGSKICGDHSHDFVNIHFKAAHSPEVLSLLQLIQHFKNTADNAIAETNVHQTIANNLVSAMVGTRTHPKTMDFSGWWPHIPDPRDSWKQSAEAMARSTAASVAAKVSPQDCAAAVGAAEIALAAAVGAANTPEAGFMALCILALGTAMSNEYCKKND